MDLPIEKISLRSDARAINADAVLGLVDSIGTVGLINPIRVRPAGDGWEVIAGAHRLEACKRLGLAEVECDVVEDDDLHAELAMIDENLCRAELSPSDRASQTARRKAIYLELHPETARGVAGAEAKHGRASENFSFASETAKTTGQSERIVQLHAERGEKVLPEVIAMIRGTKLDTGAYLDKLKKLPGSEQFRAAERDLSFAKSQERKENKAANKSKIDADVKSRAAKEVAEIIAEHVPGEWWDAVKSNLYAAGASNIANALTNITGEAIMDRRHAPSHHSQEA